jgi:hypothetical protein
VTLRPELQAICQSFLDWWDSELTKRDEAARVSAPLYHYTDAAGLFGMFSSEEVWHSSIFHMNDPSELSYGLHIAQDALTQLFCNTLADKLLTDIGTAFELYLACFSDDGDELGQWRGYGDNGRGFAIGFAPHLFHPKDRKPEHPADAAFVTSVEYSQSTIEHRNNEATAKALAAFAQIQDAVRTAEELRACMIELSILLTTPLLWNALSTKHQAYRNERERRVVILGESGKVQKFTDTRTRGSSLVPFIKRKMDLRTPGSIAEVVIGPAAHRDARHALHSLLVRFDLIDYVKIRSSAIPYRVL